MTLTNHVTINEAVFQRLMNSWERDIDGTLSEREEYKWHVTEYMTTISLIVKLKLVHYHDLINEYGEFITTKKDHDEKTETRFTQGLNMSQSFYFLRGHTASYRTSVEYQEDTNVYLLVLDCDAQETLSQVTDAVRNLYETTKSNNVIVLHGGNAIRVTDQCIYISLVKGTLLWIALCEKEIPDWITWYKPLLNEEDV
jgi:hypothetical protein